MKFQLKLVSKFKIKIKEGVEFEIYNKYTSIWEKDKFYSKHYDSLIGSSYWVTENGYSLSESFLIRVLNDPNSSYRYSIV